MRNRKYIYITKNKIGTENYLCPSNPIKINIKPVFEQQINI
jgi:hypothetical protein